MAEALFRARVEEREISGVSVGSVGLLFDGRPAESGAVAAMAKRGIDIGDHRARTLETVDLDAADLVVAMESVHLHELVTVGVGADRAFTFPDLVARAEQLGPRRSDETEAAWIARLSLGRPVDGWVTSNPAMEVADPMGGSRRRFRRCADELAGLIDRFVAVAWPEPEPADADAKVKADADRSTAATDDTWSTT